MIGAIILAAGRSRRMGTQKLLLPFGKGPLIARVVDEVIHSRVNHILVVIRSDGARIRESLEAREIDYVVNPIPESDMLTSVRCGIRALPSGFSAALIVLGDQPGIRAGLIDDLITTQSRLARSLVVPSHGGCRGHPLLIGSVHFPGILGRYDEVGLCGLLREHSEEVAEVPVTSSLLLEDMDVPDDYTRLSAALSQGKAVGSASGDAEDS